MAQVPQYGSFGNVQSQNLPAVYNNNTISPNDLGAGNLSAVGQSLSVAMGFANEQIDKMNKNAARESLNTAQSQIQDFYNQASQRTPQENINFIPEMKAKVEEIQRNSSKDMTIAQKEYFDSSFGAVANSYNEHAYKFQTQQQEKYANSNIDAHIDLNLQKAFITGDLKDFDNSVIGGIEEKYKTSLSPDAIKLLAQQKMTEGYVSYASKMANPQQAITFLDDNKEKLNPIALEQAKTTFKKVLKETELQAMKTPPDIKLYYSLKNMPYKDLMNVDFSDPAYDGLTGDHRKELLNDVEALRKGDEQTIEKYNFNSQVNTSFKSLGYDVNDKNNAKAKEAQTKYAQYQDQLSSYLKTLTPEQRKSKVEIDKAIKYMNEPQIIAEHWYGNKTVRRWETPYLKAEQQLNKAQIETKNSLKDYDVVVQQFHENNPENVIKDGDKMIVLMPNGSERVYEKGNPNPMIIIPDTPRNKEKIAKHQTMAKKVNTPLIGRPEYLNEGYFKNLP